MEYETIKNIILQKPEVVEDYPFGPDVLVFKIKNKMFALLTITDGVARINLKCEPYKAAALRDAYESVIPGYHMNKLHWNTVILNDSIPKSEIVDMIDHSYALVVNGLKKTDKNALFLTYGKDAILHGLE